ncbi:hypothetical protein [Archaeoglobus neptunius]|uniref:hypothetical protein n=1 Tax=Archaeoglobus neptunius TaxID=2798580 RepID=UPI001927EC5B|nr:hypothetical protein [Archaeoglobus neptunius]
MKELKIVNDKLDECLELMLDSPAGDKIAEVVNERGWHSMLNASTAKKLGLRLL